MQGLGDFDGAVAEFQKALEINPEDLNAQINLAATFIELKRYDEAIDFSRRALRSSSDVAEAHHSLGVAYLRIGDCDSAREELLILQKLNEALAADLKREMDSEGPGDVASA